MKQKYVTVTVCTPLMLKLHCFDSLWICCTACCRLVDFSYFQHVQIPRNCCRLSFIAHIQLMHNKSSRNWNNGVKASCVREATFSFGSISPRDVTLWCRDCSVKIREMERLSCPHIWIAKNEWKVEYLFLAADRAGGIFSACPSVYACVCAYVRTSAHLRWDKRNNVVTNIYFISAGCEHVR